MPEPAVKAFVDLYPTADRLLAAPQVELERVLLDYCVKYCSDGMHPMLTREGVAAALLGWGGYEVDAGVREAVRKTISRTWKALEDANLLEEPDPANGRSGYRVPSPKGRAISTEFDFAAAKIRTRFERDMFHPSLPDAAWNAFRTGDYDTAVFEAFKAVESAVRKKSSLSAEHGVKLMEKAFDQATGKLTDPTASTARKNARCNLFRGAFGEIRNPRAHGDPTITDPLVAVEELMTASMLLRIVDGV